MYEFIEAITMINKPEGLEYRFDSPMLFDASYPCCFPLFVMINTFLCLSNPQLPHLK